MILYFNNRFSDQPDIWYGLGGVINYPSQGHSSAVVSATRLSNLLLMFVG